MIRAFILASLLSISLASTARAEDPVARQYLEQGMHQRDLGNDAGALVLFERAYAIEQSPRAQAQIGLCQLAMGDWMQGYVTLAAAMSHDRDPWIVQRRAALTEALSAARMHVGFVHVIGGDPGQHVWVGGNDAGALPHPEPIAAGIGDVTVELRDGATVLDSRRVTVSVGTTIEVTLVAPEVRPTGDISEEESETTTPPPHLEDNAVQAPSSGPYRVLGWSAIGVGGVGLITGVVFHVMRENAASHQRACYPNGTDFDDSVCPEGEAEAISSVTRNTTGQVIGYVAGATLIVTGALILLLTSGSSESESSSAFACGPNLDNIGASCAGRF